MQWKKNLEHLTLLKKEVTEANLDIAGMSTFLGTNFFEKAAFVCLHLFIGYNSHN